MAAYQLPEIEDRFSAVQNTFHNKDAQVPTKALMVLKALSKAPKGTVPVFIDVTRGRTTTRVEIVYMHTDRIPADSSAGLLFGGTGK